MELGHLLTRSGLTYPQVSSKVYRDSFCQLRSSVSLSWVIYFEAFYLHVVSSFSCIPVICPKLVLLLTPLQFVHLFCNLSKCLNVFTYHLIALPSKMTCVFCIPRCMLHAHTILVALVTVSTYKALIHIPCTALTSSLMHKSQLRHFPSEKKNPCVYDFLLWLILMNLSLSLHRALRRVTQSAYQLMHTLNFILELF